MSGVRVIATTVLVSLAASLQATFVYLTRSFYAMGRDGVLPPVLGGLDRRDQPALAIVVITGVGIAFTLGSGLSPTIKSVFEFILSGTSVFLGILFILGAAAAVRIFAGNPQRRITGVILPAIGTAALAILLSFSFVESESRTRLFIIVTALAGLPLAFWRARASERQR